MGPWAHGPMGPMGPWAHGAHGAQGPRGGANGGGGGGELMASELRPVGMRINMPSSGGSYADYCSHKFDFFDYLIQ